MLWQVKVLGRGFVEGVGSLNWTDGGIPHPLLQGRHELALSLRFVRSEQNKQTKSHTVDKNRVRFQIYSLDVLPSITIR